MSLTTEQKAEMAILVANVMQETYGPVAAISLAQPLALAMHTLETNDMLKSPSVVTEAEQITTETGHHRALATIQAICEARELMVSDQDRDIIAILSVCNQEIGESGADEH